MGHRRDRLKLRQLQQKESRHRNAPRKYKERARRAARMRAAIESGKMPYSPLVRTWLCEQLGKKERKITEKDIKSLLGASQ